MSSVAPDRLVLENLFAAIDAMDTARFTDFFKDDALFRFGSRLCKNSSLDIITLST